jgi:uncharacterized protein (DUF2141 family)
MAFRRKPVAASLGRSYSDSIEGACAFGAFTFGSPTMSTPSFRIPRASRPTFAAVVLALACGLAHAADLTIEVQGARSAQGSVAGALFTSAAGWMKPSQALQGQFVPAADKAILFFRGLPPGRYALSVYHDENGNAKLDTNPVGMPTERYGFTRDAHGRMGPPAFDDAVLDVQADTTVTVQLR